jgi:hypothetical protein
MSDEIEAAGALATATLAANALPGADGHAQGTHDSTCRNCGAALAGAYCSACGQPAHLHRSLLHLAEEVLHGLYHFDAKGWRTLPLLVARPGLLTRRYIDGQRTRYVSPLALFLFTVFLMFLVFSFTTRSPIDMVPTSTTIASTPAELQAEVARAQDKVATARAALEAARQSGGDAAQAREDLAEAQGSLREAEKELRQPATPQGRSAIGPGSAASGVVVDTGWRDELRNLHVNTGHPGLDQAIRRAAANPELTLYKLKNAAYKFSFLLVPISLPFLWLMFFWRRGIVVYDHAVFTLYSLSFMSLLLIVAALLSAAHVPSGLLELLVFVPPVHMFLQLRGTYGLSTSSTLWRTFALMVAATLVLTLFTLIIIAVTMG